MIQSFSFLNKNTGAKTDWQKQENLKVEKKNEQGDWGGIKNVLDLKNSTLKNVHIKPQLNDKEIKKMPLRISQLELQLSEQKVHNEYHPPFAVSKAEKIKKTKEKEFSKS